MTTEFRGKKEHFFDGDDTTRRVWMIFLMVHVLDASATDLKSRKIRKTVLPFLLTLLPPPPSNSNHFTLSENFLKI
jgi:hypothetical protein